MQKSNSTKHTHTHTNPPIAILVNSGVCSVFVGHPIDLIKVRQQVAAAAPSNTASATRVAGTANIVLGSGGTSTIGMLRTVFVTEGIPGLYRGVTAPLLAVTPAFAVSFWSYDVAVRAIREYDNLDKTQQLSIQQTAVAGGFSGLPLAVIFGPSERIKCLMQVDKTRYSGFTDCLRQVYKEGGVRSVLKGTLSTALRDVPGNAAYFGAYEIVKRFSCQLEGRTQASTFGTLIAGGCAGVANWIVAIPFDTVK